MLQTSSNIKCQVRIKNNNSKYVMDNMNIFYRCSPSGVWHYRFGLNILPQNRLEKRSDLSGVVFRTAANNDPPFVRTVNVKLGELDFSSPVAGHLQDTRIGLENIHLGSSLYGDLWESLQKLLNFNYTMVRF